MFSDPRGKRTTIIIAGVLVLGAASAYWFMKKGPSSETGGDVASGDLESQPGEDLRPQMGAVTPGTPGLQHPAQRGAESPEAQSDSGQPVARQVQPGEEHVAGQSAQNGQSHPQHQPVAGQLSHDGQPVARQAQPSGQGQTPSGQYVSQQLSPSQHGQHIPVGGVAVGGTQNTGHPAQAGTSSHRIFQGPLPGPLAPAELAKLEAAQQQSQGGELKPLQPQDSCVTVTYRHKHQAGGKACSHHKNLIRVRAAEGLKFNPKTVCIRVNGTPVKSSPAPKGKPGDYIIGTVIGSDTLVTARFCTGKLTCKEDCKIPKDDFVEAIGGTDMDTTDKEQLAIAVWDKEDPNEKEAAENVKLQKDMHKELKDLDEVAKSAAEGFALFQDWLPESEAPACLSGKAEGPSDNDRKVAAHGGRS